jgi:hypothetical protein
MTTLQKTIPSYLYTQYADDDDLQAFVASYNQITQTYINTFNQLNLPVYTGLSGALLDWVGRGVYGYPRPTIPAVAATTIGPINTYGPDFFVPLNTQESTAASNYNTTDDIYKRLLTWHFYKGDGKVFNISWLKRRIVRFLYGTDGISPVITQTYDIGVTFSAGNNVDIIMPASPQADILIAAVGVPHLVTTDFVKPGATVIDVGINRVPFDNPEQAAAGKTKLVGDVAYKEALAVAGHITPVPGGVGLMTVACLLQNTVTAAKRIAGIAD